MMHRRDLMVGATALAAALAGRAQDAPRLPRLGILQTATATAGLSAQTIAALRQGLRDHGYVEGRNLALELRSADGRPEALPALAAELVRREVDAIYAFGPAAVRAGSFRSSRSTWKATRSKAAGPKAWLDPAATSPGCFSICRA